jgi:hypothetical protein
VQTIDESKQFFLGEIGFKDTYKFNIAAWKLARLIGLDDMVPPSVRRTFEGKAASYTWWVDDVMMDETERRSKNLQAPDQTTWQNENNIMQAFDQLIYNVDRNQTNILIDKNWHLWLIDHGRSFRTKKELKDPSVMKESIGICWQRMKLSTKTDFDQGIRTRRHKAEIEGCLRVVI